MEGPRLLLRRWTVDDLEVVEDLIVRNLDHLRPWMPWIAKEPLSRDDRRHLVEEWDRTWRSGADVVLAIVGEDGPVGGTGLHRRGATASLHIGYWVDKDHLGQGIATETASMLTTVALSHPGVQLVEIHHDKANVRSAGVPRRLGYRFLGERPDAADAPGEIGTDCAWGMDAGSWSRVISRSS